MGELRDLAAERAVLAGVYSSGDVFLDVEYLLQTETFTDSTNQVVWACLKALRTEDPNCIIDLPLFRSKAKQLQLQHVVEHPDELSHIKRMLEFKIEHSNVVKFASIIRKLEIARLIASNLEEARDEVIEVKGTETTDHILSIAENKIFDLSSLLTNDREQGIVHIGDGLREYVQYLMENERDMIGISSGYPIWDSMLGGIRRKGVTLIGARSNVGKSFIADCVAMHVTEQLGIPVLMLDTEMAQDGHWNRLLSYLSGVDSREIEKGKFSRNEIKVNKINDAVEKLEGFPYYYVNIAGKEFEETLSYIRRWLLKEVGVDENGKMKDCLIIYDYLKMMSSGGLADMKEYQIMGFQMTSLHNFAVRYDVPILSFVQLNRDGIDGESSAAISQSDRILWLATSVSFYKVKSDEEMAASMDEGDRKMIVIKNRFGPISDRNEYINFKFYPSIAKIIEGRLSSSIPKDHKDYEANKKTKRHTGKSEFEKEDDTAEPVRSF